MGGIAEAVVAEGVTAEHRRMLEVRRREGNQAVWAAAGELGEPARRYAARLLAVEEALAEAADESH